MPSHEERAREIVAGYQMLHASVGVGTPFGTDELARLVVEALAEVEREAIAAERARVIEAASALARGEPAPGAERHRQWPWWGTGNRANDDAITQFADALSDAIRALGEDKPAGGADL